MKKQWKKIFLLIATVTTQVQTSVYNNARDYTKSYLPTIGSITLTANSPQLAQQIKNNSLPGTWAVNQRNGINGIINNYIGNGAFPDVVNAMVVDSNGSFVIVGNTPDAPTQSLMVRYLSNGVLDTTFGAGGYFIFDGSQAGTANKLNCIITDGSGGYYVGGMAVTAIQGFVAHVTESGKLATTFGTQGIAQLLAFNGVTGIALQSTGIVCTGTIAVRYLPHFLVTRLTFAGQPDTTFTLFEQSIITPYGITIDSQQRIIIAGDNEGPRNPGTTTQIYRINPNGGAEDPSFNNGQPFNSNSYARALLVLPDDSIIVAGATQGLSSYLITKITSAGTLDTSFGESGVVTVTPKTGGVGGTPTIANAVIALPNGNIAVAGQASNGTLDWFGTVLLNADGSLNQSFSIPGQLGDAGVGTAVVQIAGSSAASCIGYQPNYLNSGLVVAGVVNGSNNLGAIFYTNVGVTN